MEILGRRAAWPLSPPSISCEGDRTTCDANKNMLKISLFCRETPGPPWDLWPSLWTEKSKLYAGIFVSQGPSGTYGVGWMRGAAGYPMGCQIGRLTRHETPLARPSQATKTSKPNRFAYPFRSRPKGVYRPLWLNLALVKTSSYRDTANLGLGVRPCLYTGPDPK